MVLRWCWVTLGPGGGESALVWWLLWWFEVLWRGGLGWGWEDGGVEGDVVEVYTDSICIPSSCQLARRE